jgi:phosphoenolpyruvate carboxykinase (ATP)
MVRAALDGRIATDRGRRDPVFGVLVPAEVPGVPADLLEPRGTWSDPRDYDRQAAKLAGMFRDNFRRYEGDVADEIAAAAPAV